MPTEPTPEATPAATWSSSWHERLAFLAIGALFVAAVVLPAALIPESRTWISMALSIASVVIAAVGVATRLFMIVKVGRRRAVRVGAITARLFGFVAAPHDAHWREEWPAVLADEPAWRRPGRLAGFAIAAVRSRLGWLLDQFLHCPAVVNLTNVTATTGAAVSIWNSEGTGLAILAGFGFFSGFFSLVDVLRRNRGIEIKPRKQP